MKRILILVLSLLMTTISLAFQIERVSVNSGGNEGNLHSRCPSISEDGRYIAFYSDASNLVSGDTNGCSDVFVYDRAANTIERVSVNNAGNEGDSDSTASCISADGRCVAFFSAASNLVPGDTNGGEDIFVHDRQMKTTVRASVDSMGNEGDLVGPGVCIKLPGIPPAISGDGRFVAFSSCFNNLVSGDVNDCPDIFVHDRQSGLTEMVDVDNLGNQAVTGGYCPSISADGRYVAFQSDAFNLVSGDLNGKSDVFVYDRQTDSVERVSVDSVGSEGNDGSGFPSVNADGHYVAFGSAASNLVSGDTNGKRDIFLHDCLSHKIERISVDSGGKEGDAAGPCLMLLPYISTSDNGRYVAFPSCFDNLVGNDFNGSDDVFVRDTHSNNTVRVSTDDLGGESNSDCWRPAISGNGRCVAFFSGADNLVPGDTNGAYDVFVAWDYLPTPAPTPVPPEHEELFISKNIFNPAAGETVEIRWAVLGAQEMFLGVYNTAGELVRKLEGQGVNPVGLTRTTEWDGRNDAGDFVASGVYVIHLKGSRSFSGKVVVVK